MKATEITAGLAESNGSLLPGLWRDSLTACTPGSAPGPTLGTEYGKTLPLTFNTVKIPPFVIDLLAEFFITTDFFVLDVDDER